MEYSAGSSSLRQSCTIVYLHNASLGGCFELEPPMEVQRTTQGSAGVCYGSRGLVGVQGRPFLHPTVPIGYALERGWELMHRALYWGSDFKYLVESRVPKEYLGSSHVNSEPLSPPSCWRWCVEANLYPGTNERASVFATSSRQERF